MLAPDPPIEEEFRDPSPSVRVRLEAIATRHEKDLARLADHPEVAATSNLPHPYPADAARLFVTASAAAARAGRRLTFAIAEPRADQFAGICMLSLHENGVLGQIGYWIGRPFWGQGLASAAVAALLEIVRGSYPHLEVIRAHCLTDNPASARVLEKNGFTFKHSKTKLYPKWREPRRTLFYELEL